MGILNTDWAVDYANGAYLMVADCVDMSGMVSSVGTLSNYEGATALVSSVQDGTKGIGMALMTLFFLFSLFSDAMNETFSFERFFKSFARLFAGLGLIQLAKPLCDLGDGLAEWTQSAINTSTKDPTKLENVFTKDNIGSFWHAIFTVAVLFVFGNIVGIVIKIAMYFILFSRLIEMAVRAAFMPIAVAMVTDGGWAGSAGRYIKKYVALCMQGPAIVLIGALCASLMGGSFQVNIGDQFSQLGGFIPMIAIGFASIGLAKQSITVLNDVMGV